MLLALLIYCYANGIFSSRRIKRATYLDVGVYYLTGDTHPDHDMICIDGTHIKANASRFHALSYHRACELDEQLRLEMQDLSAKVVPGNIVREKPT